MVFTDISRPENIEKDLKKCCEIFSNTSSFLIGGEQIPTTVWNTPGLVKYICTNEANIAILEKVFENVCNYEKSYSGISNLIFWMLAKETEHSISKKTRSSSRLLINLVQKNITCEFTNSVLNAIKQFGNPQLSISVQRIPAIKPIIKFTSMPTVRLRVHPKFLIRSQKFTNNKFLMINGAVSTSSEIMPIMNESYENKQTNYFVVCRSFNDEVLFTLKENYDRNITNVIPIEFGFDLESINSLPDLASVVGGMPLSADLGDVISVLDKKRLGYCEKLSIHKNYMSFVSHKNNNLYIKNLSKKVNLADDETRKLLAKRLINLKGNSCNIFLPEKINYNQIEVNLRHAARIFSDMSKKGIICARVKTKKFYIPAHDDTIIQSLHKDVNNLLKTGIYLPRRNRK